jgi:hypothetical protein
MECHLASSVSGPRQPSLASSSCFGRASFSLFWTVSYCLLSYSGAASALVILEMCLPPQLRILSTPWIQSMRVSLLKIGPSQKRGQGSTAFNNTSTTLQQQRGRGRASVARRLQLVDESSLSITDAKARSNSRSQNCDAKFLRDST